jgi:hypothetical protein
VKNLNKLVKFGFVLLILLPIFISPSVAQDEEILFYYSDKMVKNGTFTWKVNQSDNFYEELPVNASFTVQLKDPLYPGPITEDDLQRIYASITVDGEKYTGNGFPLFWHIRKVNDTVETTIREDFENEPTLFNVSDATPAPLFRVNFTISDGDNVLYVEMDIDPDDGITKRYFEHFDDGAGLESTLELVFDNYIVEASFQYLWALVGIIAISSFIAIRRKRRN